MKRRIHPVMGHHLPPPRPTLFALFLIAAALSMAFLLALGLYRLCLN